MESRSVSFVSRGRVWALMVVITLVAAFLRFYQLGAQSLWDGEIFTLLFAQYAWSKFFASVSTFSAHPPLWFALSKVIITLGWNEFLLRVPAAFAGIVSVPALFVLGKRFFDVRVALIGALLLALSPINVLFSQNARNYAFFVLLAILLVYGAYRAAQGKWKNEGLAGNNGTEKQSGEIGARRYAIRDLRVVWWLLFVVVAIAGLYTHYLFVLPLAGTVLAFTLKLIYDAARQTGWRAVGGWWRIALKSARPFLIALIAILALYLPWTPTVGSAFLDRQLTRESSQDADDNAALTLQDAPRLLKDFSGAETWGWVLFALLAIVGIAWAWRTRQRAVLFWFGIALVLPIGVMVLLAPRRLPAKYLIYVLPAYLLFVSQGIVGIHEFFAKGILPSPRRAFAVTAIVLALLVLATVPNLPYWNGTQTIFTGKGWAVVDEWKLWREAAARVMQRAAPGDFVLFPLEARALTARSVVPYFSDAFLQNLYSAPPKGRVWWVSETADVPTANATWLQGEDNLGKVVVQQLARPARFQEVALPNASFEEGSTDWERSSDAAKLVRDTRDAVAGAASARVTLTQPQLMNLRSREFAVTPGKLYRVTAHVKNPTIGFYTASPQLVVNFYEASNRPPKRTRLATVIPSDKPGWMLMISDGIVPDDAQTARVEFAFRNYAYELGPTSWIDNVRVWLEE